MHSAPNPKGTGTPDGSQYLSLVDVWLAKLRRVSKQHLYGGSLRLTVDQCPESLTHTASRCTR